jgi:hypothetical protein
MAFDRVAKDTLSQSPSAQGSLSKDPKR